MAAEVVFILLCIAGVFALTMRQTSLWGWAFALAAVNIIWQTGILHGEFYEPDFTFGQVLSALKK